MDIRSNPSEDKNYTVRNDEESGSIQKTLADLFLGSWLKTTAEEKLLTPEINVIVLGIQPPS